MVIKEIEVKGIMTKSNLPVSDYSINPYVGCAHACKYCYASFMKRFTDHPEPWGEFVDVKNWKPIQKAEKYAGKEAFFGSVTDCYQPCEAKYMRTRLLLEQLQGSGISISIATKSDLVLRDLGQHRTKTALRLSATSACIFSVILHRNPSTYVSMPSEFLYNLTKNLTAHLRHYLCAVLP